MAISNLTRIVQSRGTKAQVEAYGATLEEGALAFATDTREIGIYTGAAWVWLGAGAGEVLVDDDGEILQDDDSDALHEG